MGIPENPRVTRETGQGSQSENGRNRRDGSPAFLDGAPGLIIRTGLNVKRSRRGGRRPQHGGGGNNSGGGGGGNNGGGGFNPNRTYDSNGPEVKIRGSASHVYEKYLQLARDANSSGDRVMAENYLQHAEHFYRIVAATAAQQARHQAQQAAHAVANGQQPRQGEQPQSDALQGAVSPSFSLADNASEGEGDDAEAN